MIDLKLPENIRKYRKKMDLTQEALAEALGVTVGAVSKWENGNNVPDIITMMELANFFNISVDELLGYTMSSKNVDDMCESIQTLCYDHDFDGAILEANNALARYPHNFKVIFSAASAHYLKSYTVSDRNESETAAALFKSALAHLSQNTDPEISEFSIKLKIAELYSELEPDKALELLKEINYNGINDYRIAQVLQETGKTAEADEYFARAFIINLAQQYSIIVNASSHIAASESEKDINTALDLVDTGLVILESCGIKDTVNYTHKLKSALHILKALFLAGLNRVEDMKAEVRESYRLASLFDREASSDEMSTSIKYFRYDKIHLFDNIGSCAVTGIDTILTNCPVYISKGLLEKMGAVREYWQYIKEKADS